MLENWSDLETFAEEVKSEAGFIFGYKRIFERVLEEDELAEGLKITSEANRIRMGLYRHLAAREDLRAELNGMLAAGMVPDEKKVKALRKIEDQIFSAAYHVVRLRGPLDDFLFSVDIPPRNRYNVKDKDMEESDYGAGY